MNNNLNNEKTNSSNNQNNQSNPVSQSQAQNNVMPNETVNPNPTSNTQSIQPNPVSQPQTQNNDEELLKAFIGKNYDKITKQSFNLAGFFVTSFYFYYRKMFLYKC